MRGEIKHSHFDNVAELTKTLHDGVRGLRTELDLRNKTNWGKQLTSIPGQYSNSLQSEIDSVPAGSGASCVARIPAGARVDTTEVDEACALIDFVAVCRNYAQRACDQ